MSGRKLLAHSAVYGIADVFTNVVNFLLVPLYTQYLGAVEYGNLALLMLFGTLAKVVFRLGLDAGFFRVHYEQRDETARRRLAGSVAAFAALAGGALFGLVALFAPALTRLLFGDPAASGWVVLVAADVYLGTFAFVPLSLLRIADRPGLFSALSLGRHSLNIALKVALVTAGWGVAGVLWSDAIATGVFSLALLPVLLRGALPAFSRRMLRDALAFGLPKVPHGFLLQLQNLADRRILDAFVSRAEVGVYQMGYSFGQGVKFASSAFEPAWGPYVYSQIRTPGAPARLARMATYAFAAFAAFGLGVAAFGPELVVLMTRNAAFDAAGRLVPIVALAYVIHGAFLLTSIGIGIQKKAGFYPLITGVAAGVNVAANLALIPRMGTLGAAWATVASYAAMAGLGYVLSQASYPIPWEWPRLLRLAGAALAVYALTWLAPAALVPALLAKAATLCLFPIVLLASGMLTREERVGLAAAWRRLRAGPGAGTASGPASGS